MANINVTYEAMESEAKKLRSKMEDIKGLLDQMERDISDLVSNGFVTDKASVRFHESYEDYHKGAKETIGAIDQIATGLESAAKALRDTDEQLGNAL